MNTELIPIGDFFIENSQWLLGTIAVVLSSWALYKTGIANGISQSALELATVQPRNALGEQVYAEQIRIAKVIFPKIRSLRLKVSNISKGDDKEHPGKVADEVDNDVHEVFNIVSSNVQFIGSTALGKFIDGYGLVIAQLQNHYEGRAANALEMARGVNQMDQAFIDLLQLEAITQGNREALEQASQMTTQRAN